eukprot:s1332_g21.t1
MKEKIPSQILNPEMLDQSFLGPDPRFLRSHCCLQTILCWSSAAAFVAFILGARLMQKKSEEPGQAPVPKQYVVTGVMVAPQKDDRSPLLAHWVGGRVTRCCQRPVLPVQTTASLCRAACEANAAFRDHMEDSYVIIDPFFEQHGEHWGYFAIYDGHGGRQAVDFCETKLHGLVLDELRNVTGMAREPVADEVVGEALSRAFRRMDERLKLLGTWRCGCTATVVLARRTASGLRLHSANVGDSRAIVLESGSECRLSQDHRRLVARGRVAGQLAVSRALGDHALKRAGVSWHPHVRTRSVSQDAVLVIASDGLWDVRLGTQLCITRIWLPLPKSATIDFSRYYHDHSLAFV